MDFSPTVGVGVSVTAPASAHLTPACVLPPGPRRPRSLPRQVGAAVAAGRRYAQGTAAAAARRLRPPVSACERRTVCQLTLTGHSRKVTAARFCTLPHQAATGSADGTVRLWDLHRAACGSRPAQAPSLSAVSRSLPTVLSRCASGPGGVLLQRPALRRPPDHQRTLRPQGPLLGQQVTTPAHCRL